MTNSLQQTPKGERVHIAFFGRRNNGKSSLINAITDRPAALVSDIAGTTTDPVFKSIELYPIGPCVLIDTAGFDDEGELGQMRVEKTKEIILSADAAVMVFLPGQTDFSYETEWIRRLREKNVPVCGVVNKSDLYENAADFAAELSKQFDMPVCAVSAANKTGIDNIRRQLTEIIPLELEISTITGHLCSRGDSVLLITPQDIQAPKGRLILPQVQVLRDLLDLKAVVTVATTDEMKTALSALKTPPKLIITDSQVFKYVYENKPEESLLTSFSVLLARYKGDIHAFADGAAAIDRLREGDRVLIAEACAHKPLDGDIGRVKIPAMLRKKVGDGLEIDIVSGNNFPDDLSPYSLVIHCGGCMFNRRYVINRIAACKAAGVPITNYGIAIAKISGILDKIEIN